MLVAVLTQQKYNDAAVKQFFRAAVEAEKPIVVVFNQCELEADRDYWPRWLATFCQHTGARPELVYVVPVRSPGGRRVAAAVLRDSALRELPGIERGGGEGSGSGRLRMPHATQSAANPQSLIAQSLVCQPTSPLPLRAKLPISATTWPRCTSTRSRSSTFRGALGRVLDPRHGLPAYLDSIRTAAGEFSAAAAALSATEMARVGWPSLPAGVLVDEIRRLVGRLAAASGRGGSTASTAVLGRGVTWPVRAAWNALAGPPSDPMAAFQQQERAAIVLAVEKLLDELDRLAQVGNDTLRPRLRRVCWAATPGPTLLARVASGPRKPPRRRRTLSGVPAGGTRRLAAVESRGRCGSCNRSTTPRRSPGRPSPWRCSSPACTSPATWWARPRPRPPAPRPAIWPPRRPSPAASPAAARPWWAPPAKASARPPAGSSAGSNPATPSSVPAGWPSGWSANCWAICWPISAAARKCPRATAFREVETLTEALRGTP